VFGKCFEHVARLFRGVSTSLFRIVWCVEPHGSPDLELFAPPDWRVVYTFGLDLFDKESWPNEATAEVSSLAIRHGKRLLIGEAAPTKQQGLTAQERWDGWWSPFFKTCRPEDVEAVSLLPENFVGTKWDSWGDCRFFLRPEAQSVFEELSGPEWLHSTEEIE
ncbi:MAG: hypothetical protein ACF8XB_21840, partial [Planctomycetota bacterium JB042]